jgi:hypothetical protein
VDCDNLPWVWLSAWYLEEWLECFQEFWNLMLVRVVTWQEWNGNVDLLQDAGDQQMDHGYAGLAVRCCNEAPGLRGSLLFHMNAFQQPLNSLKDCQQLTQYEFSKLCVHLGDGFNMHMVFFSHNPILFSQLRCTMIAVFCKQQCDGLKFFQACTQVLIMLMLRWIKLT